MRRVLILILALSLAACGDSKSEPGDAGDGPVTIPALY